MMAKISSHNLVWIDLEMSGLDLQKHKIIEVGIVITNKNLEMLTEPISFAISHPESIIDEMDEWNQNTHKASGLLDRIKNDGLPIEEVEKKCMELVDEYCREKMCPLCGNSVHIDRMFLEKYMPNLMSKLSYRNIDVTTFKELVKRWYPKLPLFIKEDRHTAAGDIIESVGELKYYREKILIDPADIVVPETPAVEGI